MQASPRVPPCAFGFGRKDPREAASLPVLLLDLSIMLHVRVMRCCTREERCCLKGAVSHTACGPCLAGRFCELCKARFVSSDCVECVAGCWPLEIGGSATGDAMHCRLWALPAACLLSVLNVHATGTAMAYGRLTAINIVACAGCPLMCSSAELHLCFSVHRIPAVPCAGDAAAWDVRVHGLVKASDIGPLRLLITFDLQRCTFSAPASAVQAITGQG